MHKYRTVILVLLALITSIFYTTDSIFAAPPGNAGDWELKFYDDFNGTSLNHSKWGTTYRTGKRTNNEDREIASYIDNAHIVSNGILKLVATYENRDTKYPYTSGMISSKVDYGANYLVNYSQKYGFLRRELKFRQAPVHGLPFGYCLLTVDGLRSWTLWKLEENL